MKARHWYLVLLFAAVLMLAGCEQGASTISTMGDQENLLEVVGSDGDETAVAQQVSFGQSAALAPSLLQDSGADLEALYDTVNPGVVSVQMFAADPFGNGGIVQAGVGSGFVIDEDGTIVTNDHVVAGATRLTVVFYDGTELEANVLGVDDDSDLAVLRVDGLPDGVRPLPIGDSTDVNEGQWVIAIGNPFGQQGTMTVGIISAIGRAIPSLATAGPTGQAYQIPQAIQTDAAINPGNSGGPLLNLSGEVIGVNAQIQTGGTTNASAGIGFAIPSSVVKLVVPKLIGEGSYEWPYLGVAGTDVGLALSEANNLPTQKGAYISTVTPGGPADQAGLQGTTGQATVAGQLIEVGGDVVIAMNGNPVLDFTDLLRQVAFSQPGETVTLTVLRNGETVTLDVELAGRTAFNTE